MEWTKPINVLVNGREYKCYCTRYGIEAYDGHLCRVWRGINIGPDTAASSVATNLTELARRVVAHAYGVPVEQVPLLESARGGE